MKMEYNGGRFGEIAIRLFNYRQCKSEEYTIIEIKIKGKALFERHCGMSMRKVKIKYYNNNENTKDIACSVHKNNIYTQIYYICSCPQCNYGYEYHNDYW